MPSPARTLLILAMSGLVLLGVSCGGGDDDDSSATTTTTTAAATTTTEPGGGSSSTLASSTTVPSGPTTTTDPGKAATTTTTGPDVSPDPDDPRCPSYNALVELGGELGQADPNANLAGFKAKFAEVNQAIQAFAAQDPPSEIAEATGIVARAYAGLATGVAAAKDAAAIEALQNDPEITTPEANAAFTSFSDFFGTLCGTD